MRHLLAMLVISGVVLASGCATAPEDPGSEAQPADFGFTKDSAGQAVRADVSSLSDFAPKSSFDRTTEQIVTDEDEAAGSCSGACNANVCVCSGDFDCCVIGCVICWEVLQT